MKPGTKEECEESPTNPLTLPLFSISPTIAATIPSPSHSSPGFMTPPLHAAAAVPFRWEEHPGKPRPSTALTHFTRRLHLPPRLLSLNPKTPPNPSPTTVLHNLSPSPNKVLESLSFASQRRSTIVAGKIGRRRWWKRHVLWVSKAGTREEKDYYDDASKRFTKNRGNGLWVSVYEGLKQVIPWRRKKSRKVGLIMSCDGGV